MKFFLTILLFASLMWGSGAYSLEFRKHPDNYSSKSNSILVTGKIRVGDTERLKRYFNRLPKKPRRAVYLASPGGNLYEGMRLGRYFRENRIRTIVEGGRDCASACAIALLGGTDPKTGRIWRGSSDDSRLGFHAFRNGDGSKHSTTDNTQKIVADILRYGRQMSVPMQIFIRNFETPASKMYWFGNDELCRLKIKVWSNRKNKWYCNP